MEWLKGMLKGLENAEELENKITQGIGKSFVSKEDFNMVNATKKKLEGDISDLKKGTEGSEDFKKKFEELTEQVRLDKEATEKAAREATEEADTQSRFNDTVGENKWRDELTGKAIYGEFKAALKEASNKGKGDKDIFEALTKDKNYYENPNKPSDMVGMGSTGVADVEESTMRVIMGLPAKA